MLNMIQSERLKYKRTFAKKLVYIAPFFFVLYAIITMPTIHSKYNYFEYTVFNWWPLIFLPLGTALIASLAAMREKSQEITELYVVTISAFRECGSVKSL